MGQIVGGAAKPKRCNLNKLSQLGTPAAGEHILVSSDNSMNAAGQGNFDCYIEGDGTTAATALELKSLADNVPTRGSKNSVSSNGVSYELDKINGIVEHSEQLSVNSSVTWVYIPVTIKAGETVTIKSSSTAVVRTFRIYGNEHLQNAVGLNTINGEKVYTPQNDIYRLVVYIVNCSTAGDLTISVNYDTLSLNSLKNGVELAEYGARSYYFKGGNTEKLTKRVKELYIEGLDKSQDYYINFARYGSGKIQLFIYRKADNVVVANMSEAYNPPVVTITQDSNSGITGYAVVDISTDDTDVLKADINKEVCINAENSPRIKKYLSSIITEDDCQQGFIKPNGDFVVSTTILTTNFIRIRNRNFIVCYNTLAGNGTGYVGYAFYDKNKEFISGHQVTANSNGCIVLQNPARASYVITDIPSNAEYIRTGYSDLSKAYKYAPAIIQDADNEYIREIETLVSQAKTTQAELSTLKTSGTLGNSQYLLLPSFHIMKNSILTAKITGQVEDVQIGVGYIEATSGHPNYRGYNAVWIELTPTKAQLFVNFSTPSAGREYEHGLTLTNNTTVVIVSRYEGNTQTKYLQIYDELGNMFETDLSWWGMGRPYVQNLGTNGIDVELSFMPQDITKSVWVFGDSYMTLNSEQAWIYYAMGKGFDKYLLNQRPGESPQEAWVDLCNLIELGIRPKILCWGLGMNGDGSESQVDGEYVINSYQKTYVDNVVALCEENNITPVFFTIPTVPTLQKTGYDKYIRSLGFQYVDVADAVGAQSDGTWYEGLQRSDGVHPTAAGSKVIASRVLLDFAAITIRE